MEGIDEKTATEMKRTLCSSKVILENHFLKGGINSGNFTMVEGVNDIFNCTMACCNKRSCELAVTFNGICYIGTCLDKCKPIKLPNRAAGFTSHLGLKIGHKDKTVSGLLSYYTYCFILSLNCLLH